MYDDIILFVKVIKIGSFTKASRTLGITLSTITRRIQRLEVGLGTTLIHRNTRFFNLSTFGEEVYTIFCDHETEFENKIALLKQNCIDVGGEINVAIPPCFTSSILAPYLIQFSKLNPELKINISTIYHNVNLMQDNFDLAIVNQRPTQPSQRIKLLYKSKMILYCSASYIQEQVLPTTIEELEKKFIIGIKLPDSPPSKYLTIRNIHTGHETQIEPQNRIVRTIHNTIDPIVMTGEAIGIGLDTIIKPYLESGEIIQILPEYDIHGFNYYLLTPSGKVPSRTKLFIKFINDCMNKLESIQNNKAMCA